MVRLFFSYSHHDEELRDELEMHLAVLKRQGLISTWHDRRIGPGRHVDDKISEHLEGADIVLLLVSSYFLASDYCHDVEMTRALERHEAGDAIVIPAILHPCDWKNSRFGRLRATPTDGKPVSKFANIHDAFLEITNDVRAAARELGKDETGGSTAESGPVSKAIAQEARTSNLRVRHEFTDQEQDSFLDESYGYIARFFENSLDELCSRNDQIETRFRRTSDESFTAIVYSAGQKRTACRIWLGGRQGFSGDIAYSSSDSPDRSSVNDSMRVADDGYALGLRPLGFMHTGVQGSELLTPHGAAEYFWATFIAPLQ